MHMDKKKRIRHMGMTLSEEEHRRWHQSHPTGKLSAKEHERLIASLGISPEEDRRWHEAPGAGKTAEAAEIGTPVNCFAIGGGFLKYCVRQGWLIEQGSGRKVKYLVTQAGRKALAGYGITKY
jgi:hypothetical protein